MYKEYKNMENNLLSIEEKDLIYKLRDMETYMEWYEKMEESLAISYEVEVIKWDVDVSLYDFWEYVLDKWIEYSQDREGEEQERWRMENFSHSFTSKAVFEQVVQIFHIQM